MVKGDYCIFPLSISYCARRTFISFHMCIVIYQVETRVYFQYDVAQSGSLLQERRGFNENYRQGGTTCHPDYLS